MATRDSVAPILDLASLDLKAAADRGAPVHLEHPITGALLYLDGEAQQLPVRIWLMGEDGTVGRQLKRKTLDRALDRITAGKKTALDSATVESDRIARLVALTARWENMLPLDGETLTYTPENARRLYSDERLTWIPEQLERRLEDRQRFFASAPTS